MKRLIVLAVLIPLAAVACYAIWNRVQRDRDNTWQAEMAKALSAHATRHESDAEQILKGILPNAEKWWPDGPHLIETLSWLGTIYRGDLKYDLAEPLLKRAVQLSEQQGSAPTTALGRTIRNGTRKRSLSIEELARHMKNLEVLTMSASPPRWQTSAGFTETNSNLTSGGPSHF